MNRYALWKYIVIVIALLFGAIYTVPNFFGEAPAVQVSSQKATIRVDTATRDRVESALKAASIAFDSATSAWPLMGVSFFVICSYYSLPLRTRPSRLFCA